MKTTTPPKSPTARRWDHKYEPGAYGVCRRCGQEKHPNP